jgi:chloramphenicol O-acetyltransferase type B
MTLFKSYRESIIIKNHVKAKHIIVGDYSYYSGYYHGKTFEDCLMYLDEADDYKAEDEIDRLIEDFDGYNKVTSQARKLKGDTVIGHDVWIGAEAMIMPGLQIADGAVIGARSLVTKNIGPYEIWGGNSAKLIKKRFSDEEIKKLLQIKWWNWSIEKIKANLDLIRSENVDILWAKIQVERI